MGTTLLGLHMQLYDELENRLVAVEEELKRLQLWSNDVPSKEALQSQQPFCLDTLAFEQWLQFVMIPTFRFMIAESNPLPPRCAIAEMAEEVLKDSDAGELVNRIRAIDELITNGS